jgi:hypothetical protein
MITNVIRYGGKFPPIGQLLLCDVELGDGGNKQKKGWAS